MTEGNKAVLSAVFAGGFLWWMVNQYNKPKLTYQWVNGQLVFNLTKGGKGINGTVSPNDTTLTNTISWQGDTAFSVLPQGDSVFFQVQQGDKIIFTQTVNKEA